MERRSFTEFYSIADYIEKKTSRNLNSFLAIKDACAEPENAHTCATSSTKHGLGQAKNLNTQHKHTEPSARVLVYFADRSYSSSLGKAEVGIVGLLMNALGTREAVIVSSIGLSPQAKQDIEGLRIQFFLDEDLLYDPTSSVFTSKISLLDDKAGLLKRNAVSASQLPRLNTEDTIAKYFGLQAGRVVNHRRESLIGETLTSSELYPRLTISTPAERKKK